VRAAHLARVPVHPRLDQRRPPARQGHRPGRAPGPLTDGWPRSISGRRALTEGPQTDPGSPRETGARKGETVKSLRRASSSFGAGRACRGRYVLPSAVETCENAVGSPRSISNSGEEEPMGTDQRDNLAALLDAVRAGQKDAQDDLVRAVYDELRRIAR